MGCDHKVSVRRVSPERHHQLEVSLVRVGAPLLPHVVVCCLREV